MTNAFGTLKETAESINDLPYCLEEQIKAGVELPKFFMCCGTEDFLYQVNVKFHKQFDGRIDLTYYEEPGVHEWGFWDRNIQRILEWLPLEKKEAL